MGAYDGMPPTSYEYPKEPDMDPEDLIVAETEALIRDPLRPVYTDRKGLNWCVTRKGRYFYSYSEEYSGPRLGEEMFP